MLRRSMTLLLSILMITSVSGLRAQEPATPSAPKRIAIRAGRLIDCKIDNPVANALILIEDGKIASVTPGGAPPAGVDLIDLSKAPRTVGR